MRVRILRKEFKEAAAAFLSIVLITAMLWAAGFNTFSDDEVVFVSVGQGDCTHIRAEGHDVLIDGGGSSYTNIGRKTLMPYLLSNRAERVELALVTHLHMDHYLGITQLCEAYPVGAVGIPAGYRRSIEAARDSSSFGRKTSPNLPDLSALPEGFENLPDEKIWLETGTRITIADDVWIEPIWPPPGQNGDISADDENENNMVYIVNYDGVKLMITGDLVEEDELEMVKYYAGTDILNCDVLKVGHHGSKTSSSEEFLDAVSPKVGVIQVGRDNFYGHPHPQTLERLEERGIQVYRTDLNGAVGIDIRKGTIFAIDLVK
jgi:competence protein ComEC